MTSKEPVRTARDVLKDPKNCLGPKYDPNRSYSLVFRDSPVGQRRLSEGWEVCLEGIADSDVDSTTPMILIVSPKKVTK